MQSRQKFMWITRLCITTILVFDQLDTNHKYPHHAVFDSPPRTAINQQNNGANVFPENFDLGHGRPCFLLAKFSLNLTVPASLY